MWTVVYISPSMKEAKKIKEILTAEGLIVKLRAIGLPQDNNTGSVEILVPESEVDEALEIINNI